MLSLYLADMSVIVTGAVLVSTIHSFNAEHSPFFKTVILMWDWEL